ncbi:MAG: NAD(P)-dependent oxidoreductase [bacterium]|nr:NAD(P)-dependent oxidoreductase [bacterium]
MIKMRTDIHKVGITGAAGNIGTTLANGLADKYSLALFDVREMEGNLPGPFVKVDFSNAAEVRGIFNGLDAIIHLAGDPRPDAPEELTLKSNFAGTSFVFEEARYSGVQKIVFASSNFYHQGSIMEALQGKSKELLKLGTPPTPLCLYGRSKVYGETLGMHLAYLGVQFASLRIGWTVPEDNPRYYGGPYMQAMFCSKRDLVDCFDKALEVDTELLTAFTVSDNSSKVFDLEETNKKLGFYPKDNSAKY